MAPGAVPHSAALPFPSTRRAPGAGNGKVCLLCFSLPGHLGVQTRAGTNQPLGPGSTSLTSSAAGVYVSEKA